MGWGKGRGSKLALGKHNLFFLHKSLNKLKNILIQLGFKYYKLSSYMQSCNWKNYCFKGRIYIRDLPGSSTVNLP